MYLFQVIGCAKNEERLKNTADTINKVGPGKMYAFKCDISKEEEVLSLFSFVKEKFGKIHICVNNAGLAHASPLLSGDFKVCYKSRKKDLLKMLNNFCNYSKIYQLYVSELFYENIIYCLIGEKRCNAFKFLFLNISLISKFISNKLFQRETAIDKQTI